MAGLVGESDTDLSGGNTAGVFLMRFRTASFLALRGGEDVLDAIDVLDGDLVGFRTRADFFGGDNETRSAFRLRGDVEGALRAFTRVFFAAFFFEGGRSGEIFRRIDRDGTRLCERDWDRARVQGEVRKCWRDFEH